MAVALITGASSGIGKELSYLFAKDKFDLVLVARREDHLSRLQKDLEQQYHVKVWPIAMDLSNPHSALELCKILDKSNIEVDVLVNNAGFGMSTPYNEMAFEDLDSMVNLNILTLANLTRKLLPNMVTKNSGKILNVASVAAFIPGPYMAIYYATKAFVLSFSEALAFELKGTGVSVTTLCPGPTDTEFLEVAKMPTTKTRFTNLYFLSARKVAMTGYLAMQKGKLLSVPGFYNKIFVFICRFGPRFLLKNIILQINKT